MPKGSVCRSAWAESKGGNSIISGGNGGRVGTRRVGWLGMLGHGRIGRRLKFRAWGGSSLDVVEPPEDDATSGAVVLNVGGLFTVVIGRLGGSFKNGLLDWSVAVSSASPE